MATRSAKTKPRAPKREPLNRDRVFEAALELVEQGGVESLSMRRLAAALGVEAMSLYNHVDGKDAVIDGVTALFLRRVEIPAPTSDWKDDLRALARVFRAATVRFPRTATLAITREVVSDPGVAVSSVALDALRRAGLDVEEAVHAFRTIVAVAAGSLLREVESARLEHGRDERIADAHEAALRASGVPVIEESAPYLANCDHEREYAFSVELLITALEAHVARSGHTGGSGRSTR